MGTKAEGFPCKILSEQIVGPSGLREMRVPMMGLKGLNLGIRVGLRGPF